MKKNEEKIRRKDNREKVAFFVLGYKCTYQHILPHIFVSSTQTL